MHKMPLADVHFHEVGAVDAIVDIVGAAAAVAYLGAEVVGSPLPMGRGFVKARHGVLPLPPPAAVECLRGVPTYGVDLDAELVTPTGAAILATVATRFERWPTFAPERVGFGAGQRELPDRPNLLRVVLGTAGGGTRRRRVPCHRRGQRRRSHRRGGSTRNRGALRRGRGRRVGHPDHHEEGPPGAHPRRPCPERARRRRGRGAAHRDDLHRRSTHPRHPHGAAAAHHRRGHPVRIHPGQGERGALRPAADASPSSTHARQRPAHTASPCARSLPRRSPPREADHAGGGQRAPQTPSSIRSLHGQPLGLPREEASLEEAHRHALLGELVGHLLRLVARAAVEDGRARGACAARRGGPRSPRWGCARRRGCAPARRSARRACRRRRPGPRAWPAPAPRRGSRPRPGGGRARSCRGAGCAGARPARRRRGARGRRP